MPVRRRGPNRSGSVPSLPPRVERVLAGRAWVRGRLQAVEIGVGDDGTIVRVGKSVPGGERIELGERVILPAATDVHVHLREPSLGRRIEGFRSGTEAAALGGVTALGDMPNTQPAIDSVTRVEEKAARARGELAVDVVLYALLAPGVPVERLARVAGAFKLYLSPTTGVDRAPTAAEAASLLASASASGLAVTVHAEDPRRFATPARLDDTIDWDHRRPASAERAAVASLGDPAASARVHVAHVTEASVAEELGAAGISFEATPPHLLLAARRGGDARFKVNPPLRPEADRGALWAAFRSGRVPLLASDHAPHSPEEKAKPFADAPSGTPGVETMLPLLLERVRAGDLPLPVLLAAACDRPARWFGLRHGRIAVGDRANLLVVDFQRRRPIRAAKLRTACGWSAFEGWDAVFPERHYRDGELLVDGGEFVGSRSGRIVRPDYAPGGAA